MKKTTKILALVLVVAMLGCMLVACGKTLKGTYSMEAFGTGAAMTFSGSKVTISVKLLGTELSAVDGTYKIEDNKITLSFDSEEDDVKKYNGTFDFEEGEDYIKIGAFGKFTKAD